MLRIDKNSSLKQKEFQMYLSVYCLLVLTNTYACLFHRSQIPCLTWLESPVVISWFHFGPSLERLSLERLLLRCTFRYTESKKTNVKHLFNTFLSVSFLKWWFPLFSWLVPLDHQSQTFACASFEFWMLTQQLLDSGASDVYRTAHIIQMIKSWAGASQWSHRVSRLFTSHCLLKTLSAPHKQICCTRRLEEHSVDSLSDNVYPLFCFSTETICYHNIQQAHSGADGLPDRVSNDTTMRWI